MKRSGFKNRGAPLKRGTSQLRRTGFKTRPRPWALKKIAPAGTKRAPKPLTPAKVLWALCRTIIRATYPNNCYTCPARNIKGRNCQTGHFITSATCSTFMRYYLQNLRLQCYHCNINLSGNWQIFERNLIRDHGQAYVDNLKALNQKTKGLKYGTPWLLAKIVEYRKIASKYNTKVIPS